MQDYNESKNNEFKIKEINEFSDESELRTRINKYIDSSKKMKIDNYNTDKLKNIKDINKLKKQFDINYNYYKKYNDNDKINQLKKNIDTDYDNNKSDHYKIDKLKENICQLNYNIENSKIYELIDNIDKDHKNYIYIFL